MSGNDGRDLDHSTKDVYATYPDEEFIQGFDAKGQKLSSQSVNVKEVFEEEFGEKKKRDCADNIRSGDTMLCT